MIIGHIGSGSASVYTGDIGHSLRLRSAASASLTRTITTDATSTYFAAIKRGKLGVVTPIFDSSIKFNANDTLTAFGLTTTAVFRDTTSWLFIHVSNGGLYVNGVSYGSVTTSALINPRIGYDGTNYADMYIARIGVVGGSSSAYTNFGYLSSEINEWVTKTQSAIKSVVDSGSANSFVLDFDNGTSLTTLGYDKSAKGNHWTLNNVSLTAGSTYDWMLDVPGNSYATINTLMLRGNNVFSDGNLAASMPRTGGVNGYCLTLPVEAGQKIQVEQTMLSGGYLAMGVWATEAAFTTVMNPGASTGSWGYVASSGNKYNNGVGSAYGATFTNNDVIGMTVDASSGTATVVMYKNGVSQGTLASGLALPLFVGAGIWGGTAHTAVVNAGSRGEFAYPVAGFESPNQRNLPTPAILNPNTHFRVVTASESNIYSEISAIETEWDVTNTLYVLKNRSASESWILGFNGVTGFQFSVSPSSLVYDAPRTLSGTDLWVGYAIRRNRSKGIWFDTVYHTNGAATTVTHNTGVSARQMILLFNLSGGTAVPVYHPDANTGELLDLCSTAADTASTVISNVTSTSFQIGSGAATGTYQFLILQEQPGFFKLDKYTGLGATTDNSYSDVGGKAALWINKVSSTTGNWVAIDSKRSPVNVAETSLRLNTSESESTVGTTYDTDINSRSLKIRASNVADVSQAQTHLYAVFMGVSAKYSLAR